MPTGYTAGVGDGTVTTLKDFAMLCARAFGACIDMRDDPLNAQIPEAFKPRTDYYDELIANAKRDMAGIEAMSAAECETAAVRDYEAALETHEKYETERREENDRYRRMIDSVEAWDTKAEGIKDFMLEQLRISIRDYPSRSMKLMNGEEWRKNELEKAQWNLDCNTKNRNEEIERTAGRNRWLRQLRESLA